MTKDNEEEDIIVAFNGKNHKLKDWTKKEKAATDSDPSLNWKKVFEEHAPKVNIGESAPTGFVPYKKVKKKKRNTSKSPLIPLIKQFWIPFLSAVIVGLGIGFTVLIMFSHHKTIDAKSVPTVAPEVQQNDAKSVAEAIDGKDFALSLEVIQGGSFDSLHSAQVSINELKNKNIPAAIFSEETQYKIMIGVAIDKNSREELATVLGDIDLYGKSWSFQPKKVRTSKQVGDFLKTGKKLISEMIPLSVAKASDQSTDKKTLVSVNNALEKWSDIKTLNVKGSLKGDLTSFRGAVESAYSHLDNAEDQDDAQQSLLDAISTYQKILLALSE